MSESDMPSVWGGERIGAARLELGGSVGEDIWKIIGGEVSDVVRR